MVGLASALALAQQGFAVTLLEANPDFAPTLPSPTCPFDTRVVAITRASQHFLDNCKVWEAINNTRSCAYQSIKVWDSEADGLIQFWADDFLEPDLGHIIEQWVITGALWKALQSYDITLKTGVTLKQLRQQTQTVEVILASGEPLSAQLVIGADGAESTLRALSDIDSRGWAYDQSAIVATVKGEKSHQYTAFQRFSSEGPLALLPLAQANTSSIVWTCPPAKAALLMQMEPAAFNQKLTQESEGVMGALHLDSAPKCFALKTHHAKHYARSRCVLVGDAAHTLHPLAGQGVNLGFLDVAALVTQLIDAKKQGQDIGESALLKRYERQRRIHNQTMIWAMELFKRGFSSKIPFIQHLRNQGLNWVDQSIPLKRIFANIALGNWGAIPSLAKKRVTGLV